MPDLTLITRVASASRPGSSYTVHWDAQMNRLTCGCPGWTNQTHATSCPAITRGESCRCKALPKEQRLERTCRHVREVNTRIASAGGIATVLAVLARGGSIAGTPAATATAARVSSAFVNTLLERAAVDIATNGPDRVLISENGEAVLPRRALEVHVVPWVILVRRDEWTLGVPRTLLDVGIRVWRDAWVGMLLVGSGSPIQPFDEGVLRAWAEAQQLASRVTSRIPARARPGWRVRPAGRTRAARRADRRPCSMRGCGSMVEGDELFCATHTEQLRLRRVPPGDPTPPPAAPASTDDWLGEGRTIVLRD